MSEVNSKLGNNDMAKDLNFDAKTKIKDLTSKVKVRDTANVAEVFRCQRQSL